MAYQFDTTDDRVEFAITPFNGYAFGAYTIAALVKRNSTSANRALVQFSASNGTTNLQNFLFTSGNLLRVNQVGIGGTSSTQSPTSTSLWYMVAVTKPSGSTLPRFHVHDETSWVHAAGDGAGAAGDIAAIGGTDRLRVGITGTSQFLGADLVCIGIKKANSNDATIETLSRTAWTAWTGFGFEWLIGFDSSLEVGGILQDQGTAGTGDEIAITGTTPVSDPPGWSWSTGPPPSTFVPQIVIVS